MKVRYTKTALADITDIFSYIAAHNRDAAAIVVDTIEATVARIGTFPHSAPATDHANIRMAATGRFPYLIFYTVTADEVSIIRVLHGARKRPWEDR